MTKIESFQGEFRWLSNFHPCLINYEGRIYPAVENAYQAAKKHPSQRAPFVNIGPGLAKRMGRSGTTREDWETVKVGVMTQLIADKFSPDSVLARQLIGTGFAEIIEGNTWGDRFWGVCRGEGANHLGRILMERRLFLTGLTK